MLLKNPGFLMSSALILCLVACGDPGKRKSNEKTPTSNNKGQQQTNGGDAANTKKADGSASGTDTAADVGGQPGKVKLSGFIVKDESTGKTVDSITVTVQGGKNADGKTVAVSDDSKMETKIQTNAQDIDGLDKLTSYIALNCSEDTLKSLDISAALKKADLPQVTDNDQLDLKANTIVLCGEFPPKNELILIKADRLIFSDFSLKRVAQGQQGQIVMRTNVLVLNGTNTIELKGNNSLKSAAVASLDLAVSSKVQDDRGKLSIASAGADAPAKAATPTAATPPK